MNWIKASTAYPPDCMAVLLYVTTYHEKELINEWHSVFMIGFYVDEEFHGRESGYYIEKPDTANDKWEMIETDITKVIAWTLSPRLTKDLKKWKIKNEDI